jgi:hypothetical protein
MYSARLEPRLLAPMRSENHTVKAPSTQRRRKYGIELRAVGLIVAGAGILGLWLLHRQSSAADYYAASPTYQGPLGIVSGTAIGLGVLLLLAGLAGIIRSLAGSARPWPRWRRTRRCRLHRPTRMGVDDSSLAIRGTICALFATSSARSAGSATTRARHSANSSGRSGSKNGRYETLSVLPGARPVRSGSSYPLLLTH